MKKNRLILIAVILVASGILAWNSIIYVPSIKGKVVDAETGKPMKGVNVRVRWITGYADPGGGHGGTFKVYTTKTDESGGFVLPRTIKLKIPIIEVYQGEQILIYEHGYAYHDIRRDARREIQIKYHKIDLKPIKGDEEYNNNLDKIQSLLSNDSFKYYDLKFIADDYRLFFENYPDSRFSEENYRNLASFYEIDMKDYKSALKVNGDFIEKYPNSPVLISTKEDIQRLKILLRSSSPKGDINEK